MVGSDPLPTLDLTPPDPGPRRWGSGVKGSKGGRSQG